MKNLFTFLNQRPQVLLLLAGTLILSSSCSCNDECVGNLSAFQAFREIGGLGCDCSNYEGLVQPVGALNPAQLGERVLFCATNAAGGISFDWDFGDGLGGAGAENCHPYADPDCYTAVLSADDGTSSCTGSKTVCVEELAALKAGPTTTTISGGMVNNIFTQTGEQNTGAAIPVPVLDADADFSTNTLFLGGSIYRCDLDGSNLELLVDEEGLVDLFYEPLNGDLYWIQETANGWNFKLSDAQGKNIRVLFSLSIFDPEPSELVVSLKLNKLFWLANSSDGPQLFETDLSIHEPVERFLWNPPATFSGLALGKGALELFFCVGASGKYDIYRYDLIDQVSSLWISGAASGSIPAIRVSLAEDKLYWTAPSQGSSYSIYRANWDGSGNIENLNIAVDNPRLLTVGVVQ